MNGLPNPWQEFHARATHIERAVDGLGDTAYRLVFDYVSGDEKLRLLNEGNEALEQACAGLHWLARIAEEARELSKSRSVRPVVDAAPDPRSEPNRVACAEGDAATSTTYSKNATVGANASGDTEERELAPDPQHAPTVAHQQEDER